MVAEQPPAVAKRDKQRLNALAMYKQAQTMGLLSADPANAARNLIKYGAAKSLAAQYGFNVRAATRILRDATRAGALRAHGGARVRPGAPWHTEEYQRRLHAAILANPKLTVEELRQQLAGDEADPKAMPSATVMRRLMMKLGFRHRAVRHVDERTQPRVAGEEPDGELNALAAERAEFDAAQRDPQSVLHYPNRLLFMDEATIGTNEQQRHAWIPEGHRAVLPKAKTASEQVRLLLTIAPGEPGEGGAPDGMQALVIPWMRIPGRAPIVAGDDPLIQANDDRVPDAHEYPPSEPYHAVVSGGKEFHMAYDDDHLARWRHKTYATNADRHRELLTDALRKAGVSDIAYSVDADTNLPIEGALTLTQLEQRVVWVRDHGRQGLPIHTKLRVRDKNVQGNLVRSDEVFDYLRDQVRQVFMASFKNTSELAQRVLVWDNHSSHMPLSQGKTGYVSWWHKNMRAQTGIQDVVFTPARSPDKNPAEMAIGYVKRWVRKHCPPTGTYANANKLMDTVKEACGKITPQMIANWARACKYGKERVDVVDHIEERCDVTNDAVAELATVCVNEAGHVVRRKAAGSADWQAGPPHRPVHMDPLTAQLRAAAQREAREKRARDVQTALLLAPPNARRYRGAIDTLDPRPPKLQANTESEPVKRVLAHISARDFKPLQDLDQEVFEVEEFLGHKKEKGVNKLLVRWKGFPELSWERRQNMVNSVPELVKLYDRRRSNGLLSTHVDDLLPGELARGVVPPAPAPAPAPAAAAPARARAPVVAAPAQKQKKYEIADIIDDDKHQMLVRWKGFPKPTWEARRQLTKDVPALVKRYNANKRKGIKSTTAPEAAQAQAPRAAAPPRAAAAPRAAAPRAAKQAPRTTKQAPTFLELLRNTPAPPTSTLTDAIATNTPLMPIHTVPRIHINRLADSWKRDLWSTVNIRPGRIRTGLLAGI